MTMFNGVLRAISAAVALLITAQAGGATTYNVLNQNGIFVSGTITTDGRLGTLSATVFLARSITPIPPQILPMVH
jgi:hypothetical protein